MVAGDVSDSPENYYPPQKKLSLALWLLLFDQWTFVVVVVVLVKI